MNTYTYCPADSLPARLKRRLDCPVAGKVVFYIGLTGEGYAKVKSTSGYYATYETKAERLHPY